MAAYISAVLSSMSRVFTPAPWSIAACTLCGVPVFTSSKKSVVCAYVEAARMIPRATATTILFLTSFPPWHKDGSGMNAGQRQPSGRRLLRRRRSALRRASPPPRQADSYRCANLIAPVSQRSIFSQRALPESTLRLKYRTALPGHSFLHNHPVWIIEADGLA